MRRRLFTVNAAFALFFLIGTTGGLVHAEQGGTIYFYGPQSLVDCKENCQTIALQCSKEGLCSLTDPGNGSKYVTRPIRSYLDTINDVPTPHHYLYKADSGERVGTMEENWAKNSITVKIREKVYDYGFEGKSENHFDATVLESAAPLVPSYYPNPLPAPYPNPYSNDYPAVKDYGPPGIE